MIVIWWWLLATACALILMACIEGLSRLALRALGVPRDIDLDSTIETLENMGTERSLSLAAELRETKKDYL